MPIASFDIIPQEYSSDLLFKFSDDNAENEKLEALGFETHNMILNLGTMFYLIMFFYFKAILSYALRCKKFSRCKKLRKKFKPLENLNNLYSAL